MSAERRARTSLYAGPLSEAKRRDLPSLERKGEYVAERKKDGAWCALHVNVGGSDQHRFESRTGLEFSGDQIAGLVDLDLKSLGSDTVLVGELEACSEVATERFKKRGHRKMWLFDVIADHGRDMRNETISSRRMFLRKVLWHRMSRIAQERLPLVEDHFDAFVAAYDAAIRDGDEGLVLKRLNSSCRPTRTDGKTPEMIRVKPWHTVDYVIVSPARTPLGELVAKLGLWSDGKVRTVIQCAVPDLEIEVVDGKEELKQRGQVVELYGRERFESGALRHASFRRWRPDKCPEDCEGDVSLLGEV